MIIVTTIQNKSLLRVNMRILITNDDGINAPGLKILTKIALQLTDKDNVVTVAPSSERSGVGHCISYTSPMMITEIEQNRFSVDGYPADCVLAGIYHVFDGKKPDLVLSGVNKGCLLYTSDAADE